MNVLIGYMYEIERKRIKLHFELGSGKQTAGDVDFQLFSIYVDVEIKWEKC